MEVETGEVEAGCFLRKLKFILLYCLRFSSRYNKVKFPDPVHGMLMFAALRRG